MRKTTKLELAINIPLRFIVIKSLFLILFFQGLNPLQAQDSLRNLLQTHLSDTSRIDILGQLSKSLLGTEIDASIAYAEEAAELAEKIEDVERKAYMLKNIGIGYYYKGDYVKVLDYWKASLFAFEGIQHQKGIGNLLSNIGAVYNATGDYTKALDYFLKALRVAEANNDDFRRATVLQNLGALYSNNNQFSLSKTYYEQALTLCEGMDYIECISLASLNLSEVHENIGSLEDASVWMNKAIKIAREKQLPFYPENLIKSSHLKFKRQQFQAALEEAKAAYQLAKEKDSKSNLQMANNVLGKIYNQTNQLDLAIAALQESIQYGKLIGVNNDLKDAHEQLIIAYRKKGKLQQALSVQDSLLSINQQIFNIEKDKKLSNLQLEFNLEKRETEIALLNADNEIKNQELAQATLQRNFFSIAALFLIALLGGVAYLYQYARKKNKIISEEKNKSDHLLKNILPPETAEELKKNGVVQPKKHEYTTVLFTDFVAFTKMAAHHSPEIIVSSIDYYFKHFDTIVARNRLEKIKTMGDAYMCAGGLHTVDKNQNIIAQNTVQAASEILQFMEQTAINPPKDIVPFQIRIGIDSGPVVAGVVGQSKFQYDIWGDTVNVASRMEANCEPNKINVSENIYQQLKEKLTFLYRGTIDVKNKGMMKMYFYG